MATPHQLLFDFFGKSMNSHIGTGAHPFVQRSQQETLRLHFKYNVFIGLLDRDSANNAAFATQAAQRPDIWSLHVPCSIHMLHTVCGKVLNISKFIISGVIAFGLVQRQFGAFQEIFDVLVAVGFV